VSAVPDDVPGKRVRTRDPARKQRIAAAAARLFAERGYYAVSLEDIGSAAGIGASGVYRHFASKQAILTTLLDEVVDRLLADVERLHDLDDDPLVVLPAIVATQVRLVTEERALCQVYTSEYRNLPPDSYRRLRRKQRRYVDLWAEVLAAARPDVPEAEIKVLVRASIATAQSALRYDGRLPRRRLAELLQTAACGAMGI
jgi:AcrR family transcriptional regulator